MIISSNPKNESPAYKALLSEGDQIKSVNNTPITKKEDWENLLKSKKSGDTVQLLLRDMERNRKLMLL